MRTLLLAPEDTGDSTSEFVMAILPRRAMGPAEWLLLEEVPTPVNALALGAVILGEPLEARHLGGMALITAGLVAVDGRLIERFARRAGAQTTSAALATEQ